jgi:hypothetical protein
MFALYVVATECGPMVGGNDSTRGFLVFVRCCTGVCQPGQSSGEAARITTNIPVNRMETRLDIGEECKEERFNSPNS